MQLSSSNDENGRIVIHSGDRLNIENAEEFAGLVRDALGKSSQVAVRFDADVRMDITALQILCSACKTAAAQNKTFCYEGPQPEALHTLVAESGAHRHAICRHNNSASCIWFGGLE